MSILILEARRELATPLDSRRPSRTALRAAEQEVAAVGRTASRLHAAIASGDYSKGSRLEADEVSRTLGVGVAAARLATAALAATPFVAFVDDGAPVVADWKGSDIRSLLERLGRMVTVSTQDPRVDCHALAAGALTMLELGRRARVADADTVAFLAFAEALLRECGSSSFSYAQRSLVGPLRAYFTRRTAESTPGSRSTELHAALVLAASGRIERAGEALERYVQQLVSDVDVRPLDGDVMR